MAGLAYALPPPDRSFSAAIHGLKKFSIDLTSGGTDSGGSGFKWAAIAPPAPPPHKRPSRPHVVFPTPPPAKHSSWSSRPRSSSSGPRLQSTTAKIYGRLPSLEVEPPLFKPFTDERGLSIAIPRAYQPLIDLDAPVPQVQLPPASEFVKSAPPRPVMGGMIALPKLPCLPVTVGEDTSRTTVRVAPPIPKHSSLEEYIFKASNELLSKPGSANLIWCTADNDADYRCLRPGEFYNHFQNNMELTTKAGLAENLLQHEAASGVRIDRFFPRCYDVGRGKGDRDEFILDFRRSAALKVVIQHLRLEAGSSYECNLDVLRSAKQVLQRWCQDLDATHLDEEDDKEPPRLNDDAWDALVLYSELSDSQLLSSDGPDTSLVQHPRKRFTRIAGGDLPEAPLWDQTANETSAQRSGDVRTWFEFRGHQWGSLPVEWKQVLERLTKELQEVDPQWSLQSSWMGRNVWIIKPGTNSKGSGIECINTLPEILHHCDTMPNRVVQKYIERPLLLCSGRKFDIRQWVLVRSLSPLRVFLFSECYLRLCNEMYDLGDLRNRERHISNWQINRHGKNVVEGAVASLADFKDELQQITGCSSYWEDALLPQVQEIVIQTLRAVEGKLVARQDCFELYGFDLMVDEQMQMWLLEVNLSPGCDGRTPFLDKMLSRMSKRLIDVVVLGQETPDGEQPDWVKICDDAIDSKTGRTMETAQRTARDLPCSIDLTVQGQQLRPPRRGTRRQPTTLKGSRMAGAAEEEASQDQGQALSESEPLPQPCPLCSDQERQALKSGATSTTQSQHSEPRDAQESYSEFEDEWDSESDCSSCDDAEL